MSASGTSADEALQAFASRLEASDAQPGFAFLFYGSSHDDEAVFAAFRGRFPGVPLVGGTSCAGITCGEGPGGPASLGALLVDDPDGDYGAAAAPLGQDAAATAESVLHDALAAAGCPGELPELIWIYQAPGQEEAVIEGLRRVVGDRCPIIGGSSADDCVAGNWRQIGPDGPLKDGLAVGVLFSSGGIGFAFQGGYEPTGASGVITRIGYDPSGPSGVATSTHGRHILAIDGRPAAQVYNEWLDGALAERIADGGSILAETTLCPIGIDAGNSGEVRHYLLVHPATITPEQGLTTFATVAEGTRLFAMRGERDRLVDRAGRVVATAAAMLPGGADGLAGGLLVYCGGCRMAVDSKMPEVAEQVSRSLGGAPFIGCFTFGEQGNVLGRNLHGNLMMSAIAFGS